MFMENKSSKIKKALRHGFLDGTSKLADRKCYGYNRTTDGSLIINQQEAEIVKWIFESYCGGNSLGKIAKALEEHGIPSPKGKGKWNREAISKLLSNEKYVRSVLLQKTMSEDGYQVKNQGELGRVLIRNHHPAIVTREVFEAVQRTKLERSTNVINGSELKMIFLIIYQLLSENFDYFGVMALFHVACFLSQ